MKQKFTLKRVIIVACILGLYSVLFTMIGKLAGKTILDDVASKNYVEIKDVETQRSYGEKEDFEEIVSKAEIEEYEDFNALATTVTTVTTVETSETTIPTSITTKPDVTTPDTTTEATTVTTTEEKITTVTTAPTTQTTTEEEFEIEDEVEIENEDDEEFEIEDDEEFEIEDTEDEQGDVTVLDDFTELDDEFLASILQEYYNSLQTQPDNSTEVILPPVQDPGFYPEDSLYTTNSWKNEVLTIYNRKTKSYVTDTAFNLVCKITFNEMSTSRHEEAIKAQAIAVYCYIKSYANEGEIAKISMKNEIPEKILRCVEAVDGLGMYYNGELIRSYFSASTGGYSASSENVWGGEIPYLISVKNDYDYLDKENYGRVTTYTVDEVKEAIESKTNIKLSNNPENWIQILSHADTIYADQLSIDGHTSAYISGKQRDITGYVFRTYILGIRSTCFSVSYSDGVFTFVTYGFGHGVGMSQNGADFYAEYGNYTYDKILHHYYSGIVIR